VVVLEVGVVVVVVVVTGSVVDVVTSSVVVVVTSSVVVVVSGSGSVVGVVVVVSPGSVVLVELVVVSVVSVVVDVLVVVVTVLVVAVELVVVVAWIVVVVPVVQTGPVTQASPSQRLPAFVFTTTPEGDVDTGTFPANVTVNSVPSGVGQVPDMGLQSTAPPSVFHFIPNSSVVGSHPTAWLLPPL
jgi:hypothetical protein